MRLHALLLVFAACATPAGSHAPAVPLGPNTADQSTVAMTVLGNRPYIDVKLHKPDGSSRIARFLVDSGGGAFVLTQPVATALGLTSQALDGGDGKLARIDGPLEAKVGEVALSLDDVDLLIAVDKDNLVPKGAPGHADGVLPGHVLAQLHVVFDYPAARFTVARPGVLAPVGAGVDMPVLARTGFPRTELMIDGAPHGFLLDTGVAFSLVSDPLLRALGSAHPTWPRFHGTTGDAIFFGGKPIETLFMSEASWAGHALADVGVTSQAQDVFAQRLSPLLTAPVEGALGGNVLKAFRVELDYPNQKLYLSKP